MLKRGFDLIVSATGLAVLWPVIGVCWCVATWDTKANGFFRQSRIGRHGKPFKVVKIRTMIVSTGTTVTTAHDSRITRSGQFMRRWKLDELPQLWNVLWGQMSFVGPRPDVPGYMDQLTGEDACLLELRPGITGPASLKYANEEELLAEQSNPERYNDEVIWPDKVRINRAYLDDWSLTKDLGYIIRTVL